MKPELRRIADIEHRCTVCREKLNRAWDYCPGCGEPIEWHLETLAEDKR